MAKASNSSPQTRRRSTRKPLFFSALLFLVVVLFLEFLLHGLCVLSPTIARLLEPDSNFSDLANVSPTVSDDILGHRPRPHYGDHDSRGFRNPVALDEAEIVCMGDSQTYGTGVEREEAWPQLLSLMNGRRVYGMAYGGWGPTHSEALLSEALKLRPKLVIEGFYSGNDLWDCYSMVYERQQSPSHMTTDLDVRTRIDTSEHSDPLNEKISKTFRVYCGDFGSDEADIFTSASQSNSSQPWAIRRLLSNYSRIYGCGRAIKNEFLPTDDTFLNETQWEKLRVMSKSSGGRWEVFESKHMRTIFVPEYRLAALNLDDPRIREGYRIAMDAIVAIDERLAQEDVAFLVVLIPTKLLVFYPELDAPSNTYSKLMKNEIQMWAETRKYLEERGVPYVDALPALREAQNNGRQSYKITADGHPNLQGHKVIADVVNGWISDNLH